MEETQKNISPVEIKDEEQLRKAKHKQRVQIINFVAFLAFLVVATIIAILNADLYSKKGLESLVQGFNSKYGGIGGVFVFLFIQTVQVILAVLPPIQILGGVMFGWFWGGLLSYAGVFLGNLIVFSLVRKFGTPLVEAFVDEKHLKRFKFLHEEKKLIGILIILYFIPGVPKDVLTYIVPLTKISKKDFFLYVMPFRIPAVFMSTILGGNVGSGNYKVAIGVFIAFVVITIIGLLFKDKIVNKLNRHKKAE